jgi:LAS superfamily LD-carboxypeptidase LdcB
VKILAFSVLYLSLVAAFNPAQEAKRVPKGIREADKAEEQSEKSIPPPQVSTHRNQQQLQQDAKELAKLAESIPTDIEQVSRGVLPKDLSARLKKIEKLSKRLREELSP